jgi:hypothetical protein
MMELEITYLNSADRIHELLRAHGFKQVLTPALVAAAAELTVPPTGQAEVVSVACQFFSSRTGFVPVGLEGLPCCWLQQLPPLLWSGRRSPGERLPYMVTRIGFEQGVLHLAFLQEGVHERGRLTRWDKLRIRLNLLLQPNLWLPLTQKEELEVWKRRPELRRELFALRD